ncbi:C6 zinc finger domain-containing protein [Penicillium capsulatum]|uniref:C6 zinc finger domain-containing protein n=1 Tax=Penicillium capsulatum TaxID=69766 RepID=A0A9W9LGQ7_9EURO|nr:C6 zinc finger domain-containing protein [Penicillium capsulatum]KAJ6105626.1 C6 zinc finger domain-containing protein [Penicillium capsulatum]
MPRTSRNCGNCRAVKRRCDQQFPHCGQCRRAHQTCPGYRDEWELVFRDQTDWTIERTEAKRSLKVAPGIHKIKDDETYPHQSRCVFTGRKRDGYPAGPGRSYPWELLSLQPTTMPDVNSIELRSLAFFRQVVGPVLSGPLGRSFWTCTVHQLAHQDPAVRHAAVAISALYERLDQSPRDSGAPYDSGFALRQYNQAIKSITTLKGPGPSELDTVLLILNQILHFHTPKPEILAIIRHLSIFPLLFTSRLSDPIPSAEQYPTTPDSFESLVQAQEVLDWLTYRLVGLSRVTDDYNASGLSSSCDLEPLIAQQQRVISDLNAWQAAVTKFKSREPIPQEYATIDRILQARWTAGITWASACLEDGECVYDTYMDRFERIIELASHEDPTAVSSLSKTPKFTFEMGLGTAVYFVAIKCRSLPLRLKALSMLTTVGCPRETMWERGDMKRKALQIIELEHGIKLTPERIEEIKMTGECSPMPPEDRRIGDLGIEGTGLAAQMIFHLPVS